jgi:hypothetical protein
MAHSQFVEDGEDDSSPGKTIFESLKIPCNGMEISILTDPIAIEVGLQKVFIDLLEKRTITENWQFLVDAQALCNQRQNSQDFSNKLRAFGTTYFTNDALNFNKVDMDLLLKMTKTNLTLKPEDLMLTKSHSGDKKSAIVEVFVTFIKNNLNLTSAAADVSDNIKKILKVDIKPLMKAYVKQKKEQIRLQLAACDILDQIGACLEDFSAKLSEPKGVNFFNKKDMNKAVNQVQASMEEIKTLQTNMQKLLRASDAHSVCDLSGEFEKRKADFISGVKKSDALLTSCQSSMGINLQDEINALKSVQVNLIQAFKADVSKEAVEAALAGGMKNRIEQSVDGVVMIANPLREVGKPKVSSRQKF